MAIATGLGLSMTQTERKRQVDDEGYTSEHDDAHGEHDFVRASKAYNVASQELRAGRGIGEARTRALRFWPWDEPSLKIPNDPIQCLVKCGALFQAHIDREERSGKQPTETEKYGREAFLESMGREIERLMEERGAVPNMVQNLQHAALLADKIAKGIENDITDRKGIGNEFEQCDPEIQNQIRHDWREMIIAVLMGQKHRNVY